MACPLYVHLSIALTLALTSAGCSPGTQDSANDSVSTSPKRFSEEDRRVARTLSLGSDPTIGIADDPYDQAVMCSVAMDHITRVFGQNGGIETAQREAIDAARELFAGRLQDLAEDGGKSPAQVDRDKAQKATEFPDDGAKARIAMGCLQRLQGDAPAA